MEHLLQRLNDVDATACLMCDMLVFISEIYGFRRKSAANVKNHGKCQNSLFP